MEVRRLWVLVVSFMVLVQTLGIKCCVRQEREALLNIKTYFLTTFNDTWVEKQLSSWVIDDPNSNCCGWNRVKCHPSSSRVSKLSLQALSYGPSSANNSVIDFSMFQNFKELTSLNLSDGIFQSLENIAVLGNLSKLEVLALQNNGLEGTLPLQEICKLKKIRVLDFSENALNGSLHECLANLTSLQALDLSSNRLSGEIPTSAIASLASLEYFSAKYNNFIGKLAIEICKLKRIRVLDFMLNDLTGSFHECLANLTSLQALDLSYNDLSGEIPASAIASLTSLEYFSVMHNNFKGIFPLSSFANNSRLKVLSLEMMSTIDFQVDTKSEVVPLFQLEVLTLANCKVNAPSGTFPSFLLYQHDLHYIDLSNNDLVGVFPNWLLLNNTKLRSLILDRNKFTGTFEFPTDANQPSPRPLIALQLSDNQIEGKLPTNIGLMFPNLEDLYVSGNGLDGRIPPSIGNMSELIGLELSRNKFSGQVPQSLWAGCASLEYLILSHNDLQGKLLPSHKNSSSLQLLFLDNNFLSGTLDHEIWHLPYLKALDISNNNFWGKVPTFFTNFSALEMINLSRNNFTGMLPRELCKLHVSSLHLAHNKLSGLIPACYFNMNFLSYLILQGNSLAGSIPTFMRPDDNLYILDLRDNKFSGIIPDSIVKVKLLSFLLLGGNQLHGQLPNQLCQLKAIRFLDLSRNNFTGNIPACFYNFSSLGEWGNASFNYSAFFRHTSYVFYYYSPLHWTLYNEISYLEPDLELDFVIKNLHLPYNGYTLFLLISGIDLSSNKLTGKIPREIGYLKSLHALNLSHNHLNGAIPKSFHNFSSIESIDLSNNNLDGEIPIELQDLNFLVVFNVSYNNLSGKVPNGGQFSTFDDNCFKENQYLSRNNNNKGNSAHVPQNPVNNDTEEHESIIDFTSFIWSFSACYVAVLIIMATVLWINPYWRRLWFNYIETCLYRCLYPYLKDALW